MALQRRMGLLAKRRVRSRLARDHYSVADGSNLMLPRPALPAWAGTGEAGDLPHRIEPLGGTVDVMVASPVAARPYALNDEVNGSGLSWAAVVGGAFAAAALALILLMLGLGLGLSSISPWSPAGTRSTAIGAATIVWLILTQAIAAAMGGYLAGRLRTKWVSIHSDEVYFRDTAHGFLAWAVGVVITAAFLTSAATSIVGTGVVLGGTAAAGTAITKAPMAPGNQATADGTALRQETPIRQAESGSASGATAYYTDALFRSDHPATDSGNSPRAELGRILSEGVHKGDLSAQDRAYAAQVVAAQTGLSPADADKRVSEVFAQAKAAAADAEAAALDAADAARRAAAKASLWLFVALLTGAFCASLAATAGGRQRDRVRPAVGPAAAESYP